MVHGQVGKAGALVVKNVEEEFKVGHEHVPILNHLYWEDIVTEIPWKQGLVTKNSVQVNVIFSKR